MILPGEHPGRPASEQATFRPAHPIPLCPECHDGKHRNCTGQTWDNLTDDAAPCPCAEAHHRIGPPR